jgi:hypothetical protein
MARGTAQIPLHALASALAQDKAAVRQWQPFAGDFEMKPIMLAALAALVLVTWAAWTPQALAHGTAPHPKCKKGYALDAEHKCVKASKS